MAASLFASMATQTEKTVASSTSEQFHKINDSQPQEVATQLKGQAGSKVNQKIATQDLFVTHRPWRTEQLALNNGRLVQIATDGVNRLLVEGSEWKNFVRPSDINNDQSITALDALTVINELATRRHSDDLSSELPDAAVLAQGGGNFYDQNGDGKCTALDALRVINDLVRSNSGVADDRAEFNHHSIALAENLRRLNSVKPLHADNDADDTEKEELKLILGMGWTKEDAQRQLQILAVEQELGLSPEDAAKVRQRSDSRSVFDRLYTSEVDDIKYDAASYWADMEPDEAKKAGYEKGSEIMKDGALLQEIDSEKTVGDIAREGNRNGGGRENTKKVRDQEVKKAIGQEHHQGSVEDAIEKAILGQYGMGSSDEAATGESTAADQESNTSVTDNAINAEANQEEGTSSDDGTLASGGGTEPQNADTSGDGIGYTIICKHDKEGNGYTLTCFEWGVEYGEEHFSYDEKTGNYLGSNGSVNSEKPAEGQVRDAVDTAWEEHISQTTTTTTAKRKTPKTPEQSKGDPVKSEKNDADTGSEGNDQNNDQQDDQQDDQNNDKNDDGDDSEEETQEEGSDETTNQGNDGDDGDDGDDETKDGKKTTTPNPQDEEIGEGNFVFAEGTVEGRRERANKQTEIDSNRNGYGTSGPTPVADEKDSGGPVYDTGNHDDGGNHVKEKAQSAGRVKDILVKAGGGATDPHGDDDSENGPVNEGNVEGKKPSQHVSATRGQNELEAVSDYLSNVDAIMGKLGQ